MPNDDTKRDLSLPHGLKKSEDHNVGHFVESDKRQPLSHYQPAVSPQQKLFGKSFLLAVDNASQLLVRMNAASCRCVVAVEGGTGYGKTAMVKAICEKVKHALKMQPVLLKDVRIPMSPFFQRRLIAYDNSTLPVWPQGMSLSNLLTTEDVILLAAYDPDALRSPEISVVQQYADLIIRIELPDADTVAAMVDAHLFAGDPRFNILRSETLKALAQYVGGITPRQIMKAIQFIAVEINSRTALDNQSGDPEEIASLAAAAALCKMRITLKSKKICYVDPTAVKSAFQKRIIGQDSVLERIIPWIAALKSGFKDASSPAGVFFFYGSTGCGKTETARAIADELFGGYLHKEDMNTYNTEHSVSRFIGSPPGYIDSGRVTPLLQFIGGSSNGGVLLFDEIEKAHPAVMDHIMEMLDTGFFRSAGGTMYDARNLFIVMTSNVVTSRSEGLQTIGFSSSGGAADNDFEALRKCGVFRNEFIGRLQLAVCFDALGTDSVRMIAAKMYHELLDGVPAEMRTAVRRETDIEELADSYDKKMGARSMRNYIAGTLKMKIISRCYEILHNEERAPSEGVMA